ncbi:MAG: hypothetical protein Q9226_000174 [Calogaya cf. arnoldii]
MESCKSLNQHGPEPTCDDPEKRECYHCWLPGPCRRCGWMGGLGKIMIMKLTELELMELWKILKPDFDEREDGNAPALILKNGVLSRMERWEMFTLRDREILQKALHLLPNRLQKAISTLLSNNNNRTSQLRQPSPNSFSSALSPSNNMCKIFKRTYSCGHKAPTKASNRCEAFQENGDEPACNDAKKRKVTHEWDKDICERCFDKSIEGLPLAEQYVKKWQRDTGSGREGPPRARKPWWERDTREIKEKGPEKLVDVGEFGRKSGEEVKKGARSLHLPHPRSSSRSQNLPHTSNALFAHHANDLPIPGTAMWNQDGCFWSTDGILIRAITQISIHPDRRMREWWRVPSPRDCRNGHSPKATLWDGGDIADGAGRFTRQNNLVELGPIFRGAAAIEYIIGGILIGDLQGTGMRDLQGADKRYDGHAGIRTATPDPRKEIFKSVIGGGVEEQSVRIRGCRCTAM